MWTSSISICHIYFCITWMTDRDCNWLPIMYTANIFAQLGLLLGSFNKTDTCWKLRYYAYPNIQNSLWKPLSGLRHLHCHQQVLFLSPIIMIAKHVSNSYQPSPSNRCCLPFPHEWLNDWRAVCILRFCGVTDSTCIHSNSCHTHTSLLYICVR